jgi:hypothetical protein
MASQNKFRVGDRVRFYHGELIQVGVIHKRAPKGQLCIWVEGALLPNYLHYKQCRKLVKKKK